MEAAILAASSSMVRSIEDPESIAAWRKDDQTVVTTLDIESQRLIKESLGHDLAVVSEEDETSHHLLQTSGPLFVVDPLDGTSSCRRFMSNRGGHIGFGPLIGFVDNGELQAASFYHLPERTLFSAIRGEGCYMAACELPHGHVPVLPEISSRQRLKVEIEKDIHQSALLFYPGSGGELKFVEYLRAHTPIENTYRFGGFANDCIRLARGFEQAQVQFAVRAWDFPAVLFPVEAGLRAVVDPKGSCTSFESWKVASANPVLTGSPKLIEKLVAILRQA